MMFQRQFNGGAVVTIDEKVKRAMGEQMFALLVLQAQCEQKDGEISALKLRLEVKDAPDLPEEVPCSD